MVPARSVRLLGVVTDAVLFWKYCISQAAKKCNSTYHNLPSSPQTSLLPGHPKIYHRNLRGALIHIRGTSFCVRCALLGLAHQQHPHPLRRRPYPHQKSPHPRQRRPQRHITSPFSMSKASFGRLYPHQRLNPPRQIRMYVHTSSRSEVPSAFRDTLLYIRGALLRVTDTPRQRSLHLHQRRPPP